MTWIRPAPRWQRRGCELAGGNGIVLRRLDRLLRGRDRLVRGQKAGAPVNRTFGDVTLLRTMSVEQIARWCREHHCYVVIEAVLDNRGELIPLIYARREDTRGSTLFDR